MADLVAELNRLLTYFTLRHGSTSLLKIDTNVMIAERVLNCKYFLFAFITNYVKIIPKTAKDVENVRLDSERGRIS